MSYLESELDFNFAINLVSNVKSTSEFNFESESDFSSVFMNIEICIFILFYICVPLNNLTDDLFYPFS